jgi:(p)ppGpp synthase/HD superfamily hydrolase
MNLLENPDEELQCIALLHDVIEDTKTTFAELREAGFSERVVNAVALLTKMPGQTYDEYKSGVFSSIDAMRVKKADLTHNSDIRRLKGISEKDIERMAKYHRFFLEIQSKLHETIG